MLFNGTAIAILYTHHCNTLFCTPGIMKKISIAGQWWTPGGSVESINWGRRKACETEEILSQALALWLAGLMCSFDGSYMHEGHTK